MINNSYYGYLPMQKSSIAQVNGMEGAKMFNLAPNSQTMLLDTDKPICYIKETDGAGYPTIQAFDLVPHKDETQIQQESILERLANIERRLYDESIIKKQSTNEQSNSRDDEFV